jgi:hypothetical protein
MARIRPLDPHVRGVEGRRYPNDIYKLFATYVEARKLVVKKSRLLNFRKKLPRQLNFG